MSDFERLHPSLQHHIVNTLGWRDLRPLQEATIGPILAGEHALLLAPTAGGKTEAASFPVISRIANEDWAPLSVLYLAPLRALLNNLAPRVEQYTAFTGHRSALWHGDVGQGERTRILNDPPDILLTTPESLEAMLISTRVEPTQLFRNLQTVIVDEVHAFASDDRGWHMLAVLERLSRFAGRELQRLGLSATVGNPDELLTWLTTGSETPSQVIAPPASAVVDSTDVQVDWVGSIPNAATVISRLYVGEKRLVFVDSRATAEMLTADLRERDVTTFVSHGSLGREERRRTEEAFADAQNCVIVATSTLELGIDIGDLDRVIQIDAPPNVASFLQRLGRTGRREGSVRNTLFLGVREEVFPQLLGLVRLWQQGFIDPVEPPDFPAHLLAQQIMALVIQQPGMGRSGWPGWLGTPHVLGSDVLAEGEAVIDFMVENQILFQDQGLLSMGDTGEDTFGRRHFMELMSSFTSEPVFHVRAGGADIGLVPLVALEVADKNEGLLLLAGKHWRIQDVDWNRWVINVLPAPGGGKIKFWGGSRPLTYELCQSIKAILRGDEARVPLSMRAQNKLEDIRRDFVWLATAGETAPVVRDGSGGAAWWTFAGSMANLELAARISSRRTESVAVDNLSIAVDPSATPEELYELAEAYPADHQLFVPDARMIEGLKFNEALPLELAIQVAQRRMRDASAVAAVIAGR